MVTFYDGHTNGIERFKWQGLKEFHRGALGTDVLGKPLIVFPFNVKETHHPAMRQALQYAAFLAPLESPGLFPSP